MEWGNQLPLRYFRFVRAMLLGLITTDELENSLHCIIKQARRSFPGKPGSISKLIPDSNSYCLLPKSIVMKSGSDIVTRLGIGSIIWDKSVEPHLPGFHIMVISNPSLLRALIYSARGSKNFIGIVIISKQYFPWTLNCKKMNRFF